MTRGPKEVGKKRKKSTTTTSKKKKNIKKHEIRHECYYLLFCYFSVVFCYFSVVFYYLLGFRIQEIKCAIYIQKWNVKTVKP